MSYLLLSCSFYLLVVALSASVYLLLLLTSDRVTVRNGYLQFFVAILVAILLLLGHCLLTSLVDILLSAASLAVLPI